MDTPFRSILCGVEGNPASTEAARQAIALAGQGDAAGQVHFTAVYTSFELGPDYHRDTLESSLREAEALAGEAGVASTTRLREAKYAIDVLLPESKEHDLTVLGTHGKSRATGIMFGSTASEAAHGTERPLLICRDAPGPAPFPQSILFASDGTKGSWAPARAVAGLAAGFGATVEMIHVEDGDQEGCDEVLEEQRTEIEKATGTAPTVARPDGNATKEIVEAAKERGASLIVSGRRGLRGLKALGSVSERVVSSAECSVLLIPLSETAG
jgi:nucleotide-binding universal stress UspA family protein